MLSVVELSVVVLSVVAPFSGRFLVLSANIRLARKKLSETSKLAYFPSPLVTKKKHL